jgi:glycosyltransferase involved in cell wall biosynthesis
LTKKIAFFTPYYHSNRGNATTAKRIVHGLNRAGVETSIFPYLEERWTDDKDANLIECNLYHILHLYRFARWNMCRELPLDKPYILTSGGTDINHDLTNPAQVAEMDKMIQHASAITVFTKDGQKKVQSVYPDKQIHVIPQSVWFEEGEATFSFNLPQKKPIILLPAGIRAVKDPLYVWDGIKELKKTFTNLQFVIAGVVIEQGIHHEIMEICKQYKWVHFLENVPFHQMKSLYKLANITINTSISEGQPAAIMEAMYNESPVLVRKNEGNLSIVTHGETGMVFSDREEFVEMAMKILTRKEMTKSMTDRARVKIKEKHALQIEINQYIDLYNQFI